MLTLGGIIQTQPKNERTTTIMIKDTHFDPKKSLESQTTNAQEVGP